MPKAKITWPITLTGLNLAIRENYEAMEQLRDHSNPIKAYETLKELLVRLGNLRDEVARNA